MRYYILENDASGEHIIFKNRDRAMREMLKQYKDTLDAAQGDDHPPDEDPGLV